MFKNAKYVEWRNTVPPAFSNQQPFSLKIPVDRNWDTAKRRILFVLEHVDTEDLRSQYKRLMTGPSNSWVESAIDLGLDYAKHTDPQRAAYAAINFNFFKTYDLMGADQIAANEMAAARVQAYARKMKATDVVVFGDIAAAACMAHAVKDERTLLLRRGRPIEIDGVWWTNTISLSLAYQGKADTSEDGEEEEAESKIDHANLLGFVSRCIGNAMHRGIVYQFDAKPKIKFINDIASFKRLYKRMMECDRAAVDTETTSLGRVVNRVLTIQIAFDDKVSYVVPLDHKDAAWSPKEKRMVEKGFRNFFARKFDPLSKRYDQYLLGQNLKFDMTILRQRFHIHMITWRVWDMMAGEYCLDENMKALIKCRTPASGKISPYSLEWMCAWYGCDFYAVNKFSKDDRATIETRSLDEPGVLEYCGMDVQVCWGIHDLQQERASRVIIKAKSYRQRFAKFVVTQMNNLVQIESVMEHRGDQLDMPYLMKLKDANGPLSKAKKEVESEFKKFASVIAVNKKLVKQEGLPQNTLFGGTPWIFSPSKPKHKLELFINKLKLQAVAYGKLGDPKIDKEFQEVHKAVPEVAAFTQLSQLDKLKSTYVNGFYSKLKTDPDMRTDFRIRPGFGFTGTVTGRSNSYDPNLQNIPQRGKFAKFIKRMFVAPRGCLTLKMDYSSHEVRMWGIIAGDAILCSLFVNGRWLRQQYRKTGNPAFKALMDTKGDIHKVNCVDGESLIATDRGIIPIKSLGNSGVEELSVRTRTHAGVDTTSHWKSSGVQECLTLTTALGNEVTVTHDHRVAVWDDAAGELAWKKAEDVRTGDLLMLAPKGVLRTSKLALHIPYFDLHHNAEPLPKVPTTMTTDLAWLIGCIVAEGSTGEYASGSVVIFSNTDRKLVDAYVQRFYKVFGYRLAVNRQEAGAPRVIQGVATASTKASYGTVISSVHLLKLLTYLGLYTETGRVDGQVASHRKVVPWCILQADAESQRAFMAAYLECDGNIENRSGVLRWFSSSKQLLSQFRTMLNTHGVFPATGEWRTCGALTLTGVDSNALWPHLKPYMVTKHLTVRPRRTKSGVPAAYWKQLTKERVSSNGRFAVTDTGREVSLAGQTNYFTKVQALNTETVQKHKGYLRKISKAGYSKLMAAHNGGYRFSAVTSVEAAGKREVYDLTMTGEHPSFVANGVIVHNCEFFFKVEAKDVTKEQRNSVKSIVFGAIYGRGARAIAKQAGAAVESIKEILKQFFKRFTKASKWLEMAKKHAVDHGYMYSPIWRVRNMYTHLYGIDNLVAATERRGCNAPVQGFAADIGHTAAYLYQIHIEDVVRKFELDDRPVLPAGVNTFVHDAIKTDAPYEYLLVCLQVLQWCATIGAMQYYKNHWGIEFPVEIEVEFELAAHDETHWKWDWHEGNEGNDDGGGLRYVIRKSLEDQKEVYPDLDIDATEKKIWAVRKNKKLMAFLDENYPILQDWPEATHINVKDRSFINGLGKLIKEWKPEPAKEKA